MTVMKKILSVALCILACVSIAVCGSISALADDYGTFEDGIYAGQNMANYKPLKDGTGFPNGDFEQGLRYWGVQRGKDYPSKFVKLQEENGNHFIEFTPEKAWDGIYSTTASDVRVGPDEWVSVLFKYRGDNNFQIVLIQLLLTADGKTYSERRLAIESKTVTIGSGTDGWNVCVLDPTQKTIEPAAVDSKYDDPNYYFLYFVQAKSDPTILTQVDDIQLVKYNKTTGIINDLDGKKLYDMKNLPVDKAVLENDDFADYIQDEYNYTVEPEEAATTPEAKQSSSFIKSYNMFSSENWSGDTWWKPATATAVIVILLAGVAATVIIILKKKKASNCEETPPADTEQEPPVSDEN